MAVGRERGVRVAPGNAEQAEHWNADEAHHFMRESGIGQTLLADAEPDAAARAVDAVREALAPYVTSRGVELGSAVWAVRARRR